MKQGDLYRDISCEGLVTYLLLSRRIANNSERAWEFAWEVLVSDGTIDSCIHESYLATWCKHIASCEEDK